MVIEPLNQKNINKLRGAASPVSKDLSFSFYNDLNIANCNPHIWEAFTTKLKNYSLKRIWFSVKQGVGYLFQQ